MSWRISSLLPWRGGTVNHTLHGLLSAVSIAHASCHSHTGATSSGESCGTNSSRPELVAARLDSQRLAYSPQLGYKSPELLGFENPLGGLEKLVLCLLDRRI